MPFAAWRDREYGTSTVASANDGGEILIGRKVYILNVVLAVCPNESCTCTVNVEVAAVVGVPETTPVEELRERPSGNAPLVMDQEYGLRPPETCKV